MLLFTLFTLFAVDVNALPCDLRVGLFLFCFVVVFLPGAQFLVTAGVSGDMLMAWCHVMSQGCSGQQQEGGGFDSQDLSWWS